MTRQTKIINPQLQKPWLLIAVYEIAFDRYIALLKELRILHGLSDKYPEKYNWNQGARAHELRQEVKRTSETMRNLDQKIHNYIVRHNQPQTYLQAS